MQKLARNCPRCGKMYVNFVRTGDTIYCPHCTMAIKYKPLPDEIKLGTPESIKLAESMFSLGMIANILESLIVDINDMVDITGSNEATDAIKHAKKLVALYDSNIVETDKFGDNYERLQKQLLKDIKKFAKNNVKTQ